MPVTLLVHHALADGSHMAKFYDALRAELTVLTGDTPIHILFIRRRRRDDLSASGFSLLKEKKGLYKRAVFGYKSLQQD